MKLRARPSRFQFRIASKCLENHPKSGNSMDMDLQKK